MPDWKQEINRLLENLRIDPAREAAIAEELSQHLEDRYEELLLEGNSESDARRTILEELEGGELLATALPSGIRNSANSAPPPAALPSGNLLHDLLRDVRYGLRSMGKAPAFTFFVVLTLALGIGASTTVFTVVNTLLLHPVPARDPSRLVCLYATDLKAHQQSGSLLPISYPNLKDYQTRNSVFTDLGGFSPPMAMTLNENTGSERFFGQLVTQGYFEALGITPAKGRFFLSAGDRRARYRARCCPQLQRMEDPLRGRSGCARQNPRPQWNLFHRGRSRDPGLPRRKRRLRSRRVAARHHGAAGAALSHARCAA